MTKFCKSIFTGIALLAMLLVSLSSRATQNADAKEEQDEMKQYFFVLLIKGEHRDQDSATVSVIQSGHLANIDRLYKEGKIDIAGPFLDDTDWRGLFIFNVSSETEVKKLLETDPAISSGRLDYIIHPWYGAKGSVLR
ncbi:MAG TPA: YciI family protein [Bacteroidia bacterium]|nr:YciI family protein [Bacteroidia bacterium]HNS12027.1 YciI family protein [Bacteroidia bacterium]